MITHSVQQGSQDWLTLRASCAGTASELSAASGKSKYQKRTELMKQKLTGMTKEVDTYTQSLFDKGHATEELARTFAEDIIGEDFYPTTGTIEVDGMLLLASFDGITTDDSIIFEHKLYNETLASDVVNGTLDEHYTLQMDQQLLVSGAEKCLFMTSDGTKEKLAWCWYESEQVKLDNVVSIWSQFHKDLAKYVPPITVEVPKADAIIDLPAVIVQVKGELTLCNIGDMRPIFDKFLAEATVNLITDKDFAQAEEESKKGRAAAKQCLATAKGVIDQTTSISEVTRELEQYAAKFNALALSQEKAVKTQKESLKLAIMNAAKTAFIGHVSALEQEITPIRLITGQPDFPEAMKNKRLLSAVQDAVDAELARVKIEADSIARMIRVNLNLMTVNAPYQFLFHDLNQIIYKPFDDLKLLVESRIAAHDKAEAEKLEAQRLQIKAEEEAKAKAELEVKLEAERAVIRAEEQAKIAEENRLEKIKADAKAKLDKESYDFEMAAQHEADREAEKLSAQELQRQKVRDLTSENEAYIAKHSPNGPTANINTPWAEPPRTFNRDQELVSVAIPSRFQMINAVAFNFNVASSVAEQWLVNEFYVEIEHEK